MMNNTRNTKVRVETTEYEFSHGHAPRGFGRWMFEVGSEWLDFTGLYTQVKAQAVEAARGRGVSVVKVLP